MAFALCSITFAWAQFEIPAVPSKQTSVYDYAQVLDRQQRSALEQKLVRYADSTSTQIVFISIESTEGEDIQYLGANWLSKWGIGQAGKDNGILILLARNDRRIGINTGYGVEDRLTDALSKRIIENLILPSFKQGITTVGSLSGQMRFFKCFKEPIPKTEISVAAQNQIAWVDCSL